MEKIGTYRVIVRTLMEHLSKENSRTGWFSKGKKMSKYKNYDLAFPKKKTS